MNDYKISAIVACYNDGRAIPEMYERLLLSIKKINCHYEIIFVNDGSLDDSSQIIENICKKDTNVIGIIHSRNFNSQNAFSSGMIKASGDAIVLLDGDLQDPPEIIEKFIQKWESGYEVVYGVRSKRKASLFLRFSYKFFYRLFNKISDIKIPLDAGDFSLIDRRVVDEINKTNETDRFIRGLRAWVGFKHTGIEYTRLKRVKRGIVLPPALIGRHLL